MSKKGTLGRKGKHWSQRVREIVVVKSANGSFNVCIEGGAENGEFARIGNFKQDKVKYKHGKLHVNDVILEVSDVAIAGFTLPDVVSLIKKTGDVLKMQVVKPGYGISGDLKEYLAGRFEEDDVDSELQKTIRDNLYERTVPCTTRAPRGDEKPGIDYIFVSVEEFKEMEKNGELLESGIFGDNYYGTPKPPKDPSKLKIPQPSNTHDDRGSDTSSLRREQPHMNNNDIDPNTGLTGRLKQQSQSPYNKSLHAALHIGHMDSLGQLPDNWEIAYTEDNEKYFIDHNTGTTQWHDPRLADKQKSDPNECDEDELPYGWEKVEDPKFGTYYIDHVNRTTQFENPVSASKRADHKSNAMNDSRQEPPSMMSTAALAKKQEAEAAARWPGAGFSMQGYPPTSGYDYNGYNQNNVKEERITTVLQKGQRGFGFTIVGGDHPEELLQVKSIVPGGPASVDGKIRIGDALVNVNGMSVVGHSHRYVVAMFQSMSQGDEVELDLIRGHPLPFDPDDPHVHSVGSYTVVPPYHDDLEPPPPFDSGDGYKNGEFVNERYKDTLQMNKYNKSNAVSASGNSAFNQPSRDRGSRGNRPNSEVYDDRVDKPQFQSSTLPRTSTQRVVKAEPPKVPVQTLNVHVVKGSNGFGFTIADSNQGQRIKQIMDASRCQDLKEGDLLIEINGFNVQRYSHNEVVNMLKSCPRDTEAEIIVQRGVPLEPSPIAPRRPMETTRQRAPRAQSTPPFHSNQYQVDMAVATEGEATRNYDTGSLQRPARQARVSTSSTVNTYPSLRRAVATSLKANGAETGSIGGGSARTGDDYLEMTLLLKRGDGGFGFRVVGGDEEGSQIAVGKIVPKSSAHKDGRLRRGDEILTIDDVSVVGSTHRHAISLMSSAAANNKVKLTIRRWNNGNRSGRSTPVGSLRRSVSQASQLSDLSQGSGKFSRSAGNLAGGYNGSMREEMSSARSAPSINKPYGGEQPRYYDVSHYKSEGELGRYQSDGNMAEEKDILLQRSEEEGFGFVILSTSQRVGSTIGRIIEGSPADRCGQLQIGDRLVAVNGQSIVGMHHSDIVDMIKQSGTRVNLKIIPRADEEHANTKDRSTRKSTGDVFSYEKPDTRPRYRSESADILQERETQKRRDEFRSLTQNGYDNEPPTNIIDSQTAPGKKVPPPVKPKPKRPNSTMQVNEVEPAVQQQSYKPVPAPRRSLSTSGTLDRIKRQDEETVSVQLQRGQQGYGFSLRGGQDLGMRLFILRMADGGTAHRDGRLMVGDELIEINGQSTSNMNHGDAIDAIKRGGNSLNVVVRRSSKQAYMTNTLPNGGHNSGVRRQQRFYY